MQSTMSETPVAETYEGDPPDEQADMDEMAAEAAPTEDPGPGGDLDMQADGGAA